MRISYCRPNIGTRNEARRPPPSTHPFVESQLQTLVEAIVLAIKEQLAEYITGLVDAYRGEKTA